MLTKQDAAETVDGGNRSGGKKRNGLHPSVLLCVKRGADPIAHLGRRFLCKRHGHNAKRIRACFEQLEIHFDELPGFPRTGTGQNDGVLVKTHLCALAKFLAAVKPA